MLLQNWFEAHARLSPEKIALVADERRYTYREIDEQARRLAATLQALSIQRGDRVSIFLENCAEAVISIFAVLKIGAVFMPINPQTKADKLAYLFKDSGARALISHASFTDTLTKAVVGSELAALVLVGGAPESIDGRKAISFDAALTADPDSYT